MNTNKDDRDILRAIFSAMALVSACDDHRHDDIYKELKIPYDHLVKKMKAEEATDIEDVAILGYN